VLLNKLQDEDYKIKKAAQFEQPSILH